MGPGRESHGDRVVYERLAETVAVIGDQHTILSEAEDGSSLGAFVSGNEPVLISAERMDVDLQARRVVYSAPEGGGRPDIRQGDVALRGDVITHVNREPSGAFTLERVRRMLREPGRVMTLVFDRRGERRSIVFRNPRNIDEGHAEQDRESVFTRPVLR